MYWIFKTMWVEWENETLHAEIVVNPREPLQKPSWWGSESIMEPKPSFKFRIRSKAPWLDNYATGTEYWLFSQKLISLLNEAGVTYETFPASLYDKTSGIQLSAQYKVFRLLEVQTAIDVEKSIFVNEEIIPKEKTQVLKQLILKEDFVKSNVPMIRLATQRHIVLIHDNVKTELESNKITGCRYLSIEEYGSSPL